MKKLRRRKLVPGSPVVRKGQKKEFVKCNKATMEERTEAVIKVLRKHPGILKGDLRRWIKRKFRVEWRMAEEYIARARSELILRIERRKEELRADSAAFYEGVLETKGETTTDRLRARERLDKLLGLESKVQLEVEHSGSIADGVVDVETLNLPIEVRREILKAKRQQPKTA